MTGLEIYALITMTGLIAFTAFVSLIVVILGWVKYAGIRYKNPGKIEYHTHHYYPPGFYPSKELSPNFKGQAA